MSGRDAVHRPAPLGAALVYVHLGPLLAAAHLAVIYTPQAVMCARGLDWPVLPLLVVSTLVTAAALALLFAAPVAAAQWLGLGVTRRTEFLPTLMLWLSGLASFGVAAAAVGALLMPACAPVR